MARHAVGRNSWTPPRSEAFKRYVEKPDTRLSLVADKVGSSVWFVRTLDYLAAFRRQLLDDPRHLELE